MVDLYLAARLHSRISQAEYEDLVLRRDLDQQEEKLRESLLRLIANGAIRLESPISAPAAA